MAMARIVWGIDWIIVSCTRKVHKTTWPTATDRVDHVSKAVRFQVEPCACLALASPRIAPRTCHADPGQYILAGKIRNPAMPTVKQIVHEIADQLPEQATFDDAMHTLYVRQKLERSLQAAAEGKLVTQEEMEQQFLPDAH
jgi:hypothetical protein